MATTGSPPPSACLAESTIDRLIRDHVASEEVTSHLLGCGRCSDRVGVGRRTIDRAPLLRPGATVGRYRVLALVGRGGMSDVYAAHDPELDRKVALKILHRDSSRRDAGVPRLRREAKAIARLSHENVVAVYDAGVIDDQAFVAMEFVDGQTVAEWLRASATPPPWRRVLEVFLGAGEGLAAAHEAGLVHRDFKPQNVMIRVDGAVRVMDFGLARITESSGPDLSANPEGPPQRGGAETGELRLTRNGALVGTPAYMSPEQLCGQPIDARSDQFGFCVSLYEALYRERPFAGDHLSTLWSSVTAGDIRPAPRSSEVPAWLRRVLVRGLAVIPSDRYPSMRALLTALTRNPSIRWRRSLAWVLAAGLLIAGVVMFQRVTSRGQPAIDLQLAAHLSDASLAAQRAHALALRARASRQAAFDRFDQLDRDAAESEWRLALASLPTLDAVYDRASQAYEAALVLAPDRAETRTNLAALLASEVRLAQEFRRDDRAHALMLKLERFDDSGSARRALASPGAVVLRVEPPVAHLELEQFQVEPGTRRRVPTRVAAPLQHGAAVTLAPGSYRLLARADGRAALAYPFELGESERKELVLRLPRASAVPSGFAYIAAGESWFGEADETLRTQLLDTVPIHRRKVDVFLIARHEVTYADWIAFLEDLPEAERRQYAPGSSTAMRGVLRLQRARGSWRLTMQILAHPYVAALGNRFTYSGRVTRARQDWSRFPVAGISSAAARRFLQWLRTTGRVPGARFCTELEWERAARGADDRLFPHGDDLKPEDGNWEMTYGRADSAYGPDEVGSHPGSASVFGVDDLVGNVSELVISSLQPDELIVRGGAYLFNSASARSTSRQAVSATFRDPTAGLRVCASPIE